MSKTQSEARCLIPSFQGAPLCAEPNDDGRTCAKEGRCLSTAYASPPKVDLEQRVRELTAECDRPMKLDATNAALSDRALASEARVAELEAALTNLQEKTEIHKRAAHMLGADLRGKGLDDLAVAADLIHEGLADALRRLTTEGTKP